MGKQVGLVEKNQKQVTRIFSAEFKDAPPGDIYLYTTRGRDKGRMLGQIPALIHAPYVPSLPHYHLPVHLSHRYQPAKLPSWRTWTHPVTRACVNPEPRFAPFPQTLCAKVRSHPLITPLYLQLFGQEGVPDKNRDEFHCTCVLWRLFMLSVKGQNLGP